MHFQSCVLTPIIGLIFCLAIPLNLVSAAWWENKNLPVPPTAQKEKEETRIISGAQMDFTYYTSTQDAFSIREFYRINLTNSGWQERNLLKDVAQMQLPQGVPAIDSSALNKMAEANLFFEKGDETFIITFLPQERSQNNKTRFNVCYGKRSEMKLQPPGDSIPVPVLVAKPKKDVFPVYPGASLISLDEGKGSLRASYLVKDEPETIIPFYKSKMADYGWYPKNEKPLKKMGADCPSCQANRAVSNASMETWVAEINFSNERDDTCNIVVAQVIPLDKNLSSYKMTTVVVLYQEKIE